MTRAPKKQSNKKLALVLALCTLLIWGLLGTGLSLAWFTDTAPQRNNLFHFGNFEVQVSRRLPDGTWETVNEQTKLFDTQALYEPGYVQIVFLKVENRGDSEFRFDTAVNVIGYTPGQNGDSQTFRLQDHLTFGLVISDTEQAMEQSLPDRESAKQAAQTPLSHYTAQPTPLRPRQTAYLTLALRMPEQVGNLANANPNPNGSASGNSNATAPRVDLGITVKAEQIHD